MVSTKSHFRRPFHQQHGKRAQALFKSGSQQLFHFHRSLPRKLTWKKSLSLTWKNLGLLINTYAAYEKYLVLYGDNLTISIQMQLSHKQKTFSQKKNLTLTAFVFPKLRTLKTWLNNV